MDVERVSAQEAAMAKSPDKPGSGLETESLPWAPSPGSQDPLESVTGPAEGFTDAPTSAEEAIGGGSHRTGDEPAQAARDAASEAAERAQQFAEQAAAGALTVRDALEDAIVAQPLKAIGIAAAVGFFAAVLFRR
jgi:ElaB/YqjD/DUF883 family membrane-anchored ribosome-binding protein